MKTCVFRQHEGSQQNVLAKWSRILQLGCSEKLSGYLGFQKSVSTSVNDVIASGHLRSGQENPAQILRGVINQSIFFEKFHLSGHRLDKVSTFSPAISQLRHGIPDDRPLEDGDILNVDVTARCVGLTADLTGRFVGGQSWTKATYFETNPCRWFICL